LLGAVISCKIKLAMVTITITGAGGTINYETEIIVKALKEAGCTVEIKDEHPCDNPEEFIKLIRERIDSGYIKEKKVYIKTNHLPWGG
jgi:hypothetical protein